MVTIVTQGALTEHEVMRLLKGAAIKNIEFEDTEVRISTTDSVEITLSTSPLGELTIAIADLGLRKNDSTIRLNFGDETRHLTAREIEKKIFAIRQIYALAYLAEREGLNYAAGNLLAGGEGADLEFTLLPKKDQLYIEAFSIGSWWLTLLTKSKDAREILENLFVLPLKEGRNALSRRVQASVETKELNNERLRIDNLLRLAEGAVKIQEKMRKLDPQSAAIVGNFLQVQLAEMRNCGDDARKERDLLGSKSLSDAIVDLNRSLALGPRESISDLSQVNPTKEVNLGSKNPSLQLPAPNRAAPKKVPRSARKKKD